MDKIFSLNIEVINGEVLEFPVVKQFSCNNLSPIGETAVRYFNDDMCSVVKRTFYMRCGEDLFGTSDFTTTRAFWNFHSNICCEDNFRMLVDGCDLLMDGDKVIFG